jgi:hypothetical protein
LVVCSVSFWGTYQGYIGEIGFQISGEVVHAVGNNQPKAIIFHNGNLLGFGSLAFDLFIRHNLLEERE